MWKTTDTTNPRKCPPAMCTHTTYRTPPPAPTRPTLPTQDSSQLFGNNGCIFPGTRSEVVQCAQPDTGTRMVLPTLPTSPEPLPWPGTRFEVVQRAQPDTGTRTALPTIPRTPALVWHALSKSCNVHRPTPAHERRCLPNPPTPELLPWPGTRFEVVQGAQPDACVRTALRTHPNPPRTPALATTRHLRANGAAHPPQPPQNPRPAYAPLLRLLHVHRSFSYNKNSNYAHASLCD